MNRLNDIVTREEFEKLNAKVAALIEDMEDMQDEREFVRRKREGHGAGLPVAFALRTMAGENRVRVWRDYRKLSGKALAEKAGISAAYLTQIERSVRAGTTETMQRLAAGLDCGIEDLT